MLRVGRLCELLLGNWIWLDSFGNLHFSSLLKPHLRVGATLYDNEQRKEKLDDFFFFL